MILYIFIIFSLVALLAALVLIGYAIRRKLFQSRNWWAAILAGLAWGSGAIIGALVVGETWQTFFDRIYNGYDLSGTIYDELGVSTYYRLALAGILAGALGCTALYFLLRKRLPAEEENISHY
jgi:hypothetical protein